MQFNLEPCQETLKERPLDMSWNRRAPFERWLAGCGGSLSKAVDGCRRIKTEDCTAHLAALRASVTDYRAIVDWLLFRLHWFRSRRALCMRKPETWLKTALLMVFHMKGRSEVKRRWPIVFNLNWVKWGILEWGRQGHHPSLADRVRECTRGQWGIDNM